MNSQDGQKWLGEFKRTWDQFGQHGLLGGGPKKKAAVPEHEGAEKIVANTSKQRSIFKVCHQELNSMLLQAVSSATSEHDKMMMVFGPPDGSDRWSSMEREVHNAKVKINCVWHNLISDKSIIDWDIRNIKDQALIIMLRCDDAERGISQVL